MPYKDKEKAKEYREKNKERIRERKHQYNILNAEKNRERVKKWQNDNPEKVKGYKKNWQKNNPEYNKEYQRDWTKTEKGKANNQRGQSKRRANFNNIINTLTADEWIDILKEYKFKCAYCGKEFTLFDKATRDHVIPISKGGNNTKENVVPACLSCNCSKGNRVLIEGVKL